MQVARAREPDVGPVGQGCDRAMEQDILATDAARKQRAVLVLGSTHHAEPFSRSEVLRQCQREPGAARSERGERDHPAVKIIDPGEPGVLEAPCLMAQSRVGCEQWILVNHPVGNAVLRSGDGQVTDSSSVLDPAEQHGGAIDLSSSSIHHRVGRVRPTFGAEQRVASIALKELAADLTGGSWHI